MLPKFALRLAALLIAIGGLSGCTQEARLSYKDAGKHLAAATADSGRAITEDLQSAGSEVKAETMAIDNSISRLNSKARTALSNDEISGAVKKELLSHEGLELTGLHVKTDSTRVTLRGNIPTEVQNQRAEHIARHLLGNSYVVDDQLKVPSSDE